MPAAIPFEDAVPERIIWVSPTGSDDNVGSAEAPIQSVQLAVDRATPGTAIMLLPGDYTENIEFERIQGTPEKPIWLAAANGPGTVTITAADPSEAVILIQGEDNLVIRDLTVVGGSDGIAVHQSGNDYSNTVANIVIEGNTVRDVARDGIKVGQTENVVVRNNRIDGAGDQGIDFLGVTHGEMSGNEISNVTGTSGALFAKGGSSDILIADNYIHDVSGDGLLVGGWTSPDSFLPGTGFEARDVVVTGNVVENAAKRPLTVHGGENVEIFGNFFGSVETNEFLILVGAGGPEVDPPPPSSNVSIHDNVFDRSTNVADVEEGSSDIAITGNAFDGVVEGDMRPNPPEPTGPFVEEMPEALLGAPVWATSARTAGTINGTDLPNYLAGTAGHDFISGGGGDDIMVGGDGDDSYSVSSSRDRIIENANDGVDTAIVYSRTFVLPAEVENFRAQYATGGVYQGNDLANIMTGGAGNDQLSGGGGDDLFVVRSGQGSDRVTDFGGGDRVDLRAYADYASLGVVLARSTMVGADTVIDLGAGQSLTLANVDRESLTEDDFLFLPTDHPGVNDGPTAIAIDAALPSIGENAVLTERLKVGEVVIGDDGTGANQLTLSGRDADLFELDGASLYLKAGTPLDHETRDAFTVTITAADGGAVGSEPVSADFSLAVTNVNEAPTDLNLSGSTVSETAPPGSVIGSFEVVDPDAGETFAYQLSGDDALLFDVVDGELRVAEGALLDFESASSHALDVTVTDSGGISRTETFTIAVTDSEGSFTGSSGSDSLFGTSEEDTIRGLGGSDRLVGYAGDDLIDGGTGADEMVGDTGDDVFIVDTGADRVVEAAGEGTDLVQSSASFSLAGTAAEHLVLTGFAGLNGTGNELDNTITGNGGRNRLDGGGGADRMEGMRGDDTYLVDNAGDQTIEASSAGVDHVIASVSFSVIGQNIENLTLTGADDIDGTANNLDNRLVGNDGTNTLAGLGGKDRLDGGSGDDTLLGGDGSDVFVFADETGRDVVADYRDGADRIDVQGLSDVATFDDLVLVQVGTDVEIRHGDEVLVLQRVSVGALNGYDFVF